MFIENVKIKNFKNLEKIELTLSKKVNLFFGENGHGKTNFLESLSFLAQANTFRQGSIGNISPQDSSHEKIKTSVFGEVSKKNLLFNTQFNYLNGKKEHLVNGKKERYNRLSRLFPLIVFSPDSLSAIKNGSDVRRKLIDDFLIIIQDSNFSLIQEHKKALKSRNRLLKMNLKGEVATDEFRKILSSLNVNYLKLSSELTHQRVLALKSLKPYMNKAAKFILEKDDTNIDIEYLISEENFSDKTSEEINDSLHKKMILRENAEISSGISLVGPHKHDINILFNKKDSRHYCSQGQQRALILSYKLAQIVYYYEVYQSYPILLLDDVMSELDFKKRSQLIKFLNQTDSQIFITTTDLESSMEMISGGGSIFRVSDGSICEYKN